MKKILFAIPNLGGGGAERVLVTLLNNLDKSKYDITLFSVFDFGVNKLNLNVNIRYMYYFKKPFRGNSHLFKLMTPNKLYKMMIKDEYDIVISYLEGPTTRILSGCRNPNTKLLNWVHIEVNKLSDFLSSYRNIKEFKDTYNKYDATVFVSETARKAFENTFDDIEGKMLVKYNAVDTEFIKRRSKEDVKDVEFNKDKINLISVGRFTEQKGYLRLLKILNSLVNEGLNVHLYLLGKGELENNYIEFIEKNQLNEHVTILGFKDNPYKYVKNSDLFICSSYREGYSTAVTESLIVGTPIVTTLCSGMEELLGSNNEFGLITENSDEALLQGIKRTLMEPGLLKYYKDKAIIRGNLFSKEETVKAVEKMFDSL